MPNSSAPLRPRLGDFASIVCTKSIVVGMEAALGERAAHVALLAAGRARGKEVARKYIGDTSLRGPALVAAVNAAIGKDGTRLCIVDDIVEDGETIRVLLSETLCSAGEPEGSPRVLTFTLGAVQGLVEAITGRALKARQTESVLRGGTHDVVELNNRI